MIQSIAQPLSKVKKESLSFIKSNHYHIDNAFDVRQ
jgi:hypothetical protein